MPDETTTHKPKCVCGAIDGPCDRRPECPRENVESLQLPEATRQAIRDFAAQAALEIKRRADALAAERRRLLASITDDLLRESAARR